FLFLYLRASAQGRKAARATTRAITSSAALPAITSTPASESQNSAPAGERTSSTRPLDEAGDVPEMPLPDDASMHVAEIQPAADDLAPTQVVAADTANLLPTEAVWAAPEIPQTTAGSSTQDLAPTEAVPLDAADSQAPTEALSAAKDP